ncbi:MAG: molybdopterin-guanine dinucleotide biosynthesis protein B [Candidatus Alcyoniella australis]|nr:molybdopterin-guanine dinucleotide biosynthesis protein B [Candidatus Alcyoniella australis]
MIPLISIVGRSGSGKTTYLEKLLPELKARGLSVAAVKHYAHGFEMDHEGKDTWRLRRAGADHVLLAGPGAAGMIAGFEGEIDVYEAVSRYLPRCDLVITEGYKHGSAPKIELLRSAVGRELICDGPDQRLVAVITDYDELECDVPRFGLDDPSALADWLIAEFVEPARRTTRAELRVDGRRVELKPFVERMLAHGLSGMIEPLRGCDDGRSIELRVELAQKE